jgi:riboflavin kinase / FMN adenylyltransferase
MQIHQTHILPKFKNAVVTIGTFDGVHNGHKVIIESLKKLAVTINGETVIITFDPHPRSLLKPNDPISLLNTLQEKISLFESLGIDHLIIYPFTLTFAELTAEAYIEDFLVKKFTPKIVVIGYDHHFGKNRKGNFKLMEQYAQNGFFELVEIAPHTLKDITISSTKIRTSLQEGAIENANELLGYRYNFTGIVIKGKQLGRTIGFKTANIKIDIAQKLIPANGVYIVTVKYNNTNYNAMMNIGNRPTVNGQDRTIEVHLLNFDEEIYDETLTIFLHKKIREEQKFNGLETLKTQLQKDKQNTEQYFVV